MKLKATTLYPLKEYYNKNFKENKEERMKLGRETLLRDLKAGEEN